MMAKQQAFLVTITNPGMTNQTIYGLEPLNKLLGEGWSVKHIHPLSAAGGVTGPNGIFFGCFVVAEQDT